MELHGGMMSMDENKAVVQNWVAARNRNDLEVALACWTEDNHDWLAQAFQRFTTAFPAIHLEINEMIGEGDKVVARWTLTGTHRGVWRGIPATGNTVEWYGTDLYTILKGRIAALDRAADNLALLQQLGANLMWQDRIIE
jgi:predicted ester cyclase